MCRYSREGVVQAGFFKHMLALLPEMRYLPVTSNVRRDTNARPSTLGLVIVWIIGCLSTGTVFWRL